MFASNPDRKSRWYFGGLASMGAACCTHPLDLIKVHLQTSTSAGHKVGIISQTLKIVSTDGLFGLYSGLSASLLRQATYSTTRFAVYDLMTQRLSPNGEVISSPIRIAMAGVAGFAGGILGTPGDMINVRMQNDVKLPPEQRRNYRNAIDGLFRVFREEGGRKLFSGVEWASSRAVMVTIGQCFCYDIIKGWLLTTQVFHDNLITHFLSAFLAGTVATGLAQPIDVLKTRSMNSKPGEFRSAFHLVAYTAKQGPLTFFKGFVPAFIRLGPHTIITFLIKEQIRMHFGHLPASIDPPPVDTGANKF